METAGYRHERRIQLASRSPERHHDKLKAEIGTSLFPPVKTDVTSPVSLARAFEGADVVVSLVGIMHGAPKMFEDIQWHGAKNVAAAAKEVGARVVHVSAIGADAKSDIPYARTKALGEEAVFGANADSTIIRPSLVFGPGDGFFAVRIDRHTLINSSLS